MIEGLRAGSPTAFRKLALPDPGVARASLPWAVLAAIGAQFLVSAVVELLVFAMYPVLFPAPAGPFSFSIRVLWETAGAAAAGAVVARTGGLRSTIGYVVVQLALLLLTLPLRLFACSRSTANQGPGSCDFVAPTMVIDHWPFWLALAIGVAVARVVPLRSGGANQILRAAGVLSICASIGMGTSSLWLATRPSTVVVPGPLYTYVSLGALEWIGLILGAALAGRLLARSSLGAMLLLCLAVVGPSFAMGVPLMRGQIGIGAPFVSPFWLSLWSWAWLPVVASIAVLGAREIARRAPPRAADPV